MKITWSVFDKYIIQLDRPIDVDEFVRNPVEILVPTTVEVKDKFYEHTQAVASTTWIINHNLVKFPSVSIVDSEGRTCQGDITYNSVNQCTATFSAAFGGKAYCN